MNRYGLKPCPCCGSSNVVSRHETVDYKAMDYFVSCYDCGYWGERFWFEGSYSESNAQVAINAWNRRAR